MSGRILAIGISGLPEPIKCIGWDEIKGGQIVNISDYNLVFIDFSYFIKNDRDITLFHRCLSETKFFEVIESGIHLFVLGIPGYTTMEGRDYIYSWLPPIIDIKTTYEPGEFIKYLDNSFSDYFSFLKNWFCYFNVETKHIMSYPYLYDLKEIAVNNAGKKLGFEITNFRKVDMNLSTRVVHAALGEEEESVEQYNGKLYILHTLKENSADGVLSILKNVYNFALSRDEPSWVKDIQTKKSSITNQEIESLLNEKQKIESKISEKRKQNEAVESYKMLLWEVGGKLEQVVHASLRLIQLVPSSPTKAGDDGILKYKNEEYMLEIKSGLEKAAEWGELSKLITRMNGRNKSSGKECRGIFIMNHYANHHPKERDKAFPSNVQKTAEVSNVKLITTQQLFEIVKKVLDGDITPADAQKEFFSLKSSS
jgi:hypothetical protein